MKKALFALVALWIVGTAPVASANYFDDKEIETLMLTITSDALPPGENRLLYIVTDENNVISGLRFVEDNFTVAEVNKGVPLMVRDGRVIVTLRGLNVDDKVGGQLVVTYLHNGVTGSTKKFNMDIQRNKVWELYTNDQRGRVKFTQMFMKRKDVMGQIVGIESIQVR